MIGHVEDTVKMLKTINYEKTYQEPIVYKYQFTMACIRAEVMVAYHVVNCLISQQKHMLWVLKRTVAMRTLPFF